MKKSFVKLATIATSSLLLAGVFATTVEANNIITFDTEDQALNYVDVADLTPGSYFIKHDTRRGWTVQVGVAGPVDSNDNEGSDWVEEGDQDTPIVIPETPEKPEEKPQPIHEGPREEARKQREDEYDNSEKLGQNTDRYYAKTDENGNLLYDARTGRVDFGINENPQHDTWVDDNGEPLPDSVWTQDDVDYINLFIDSNSAAEYAERYILQFPGEYDVNIKTVYLDGFELWYAEITPVTEETPEEETPEEETPEEETPEEETPEEETPEEETPEEETPDSDKGHGEKDKVKVEAKKESGQAELPETGESSSYAIFGAAALAVLAGVGLVAPSFKKEN